MQKVNRKREDAGGRLLESNVDPYFMPTTEERHYKDNAPTLERKNMEETEMLLLLVLC